MYNMFKPLFLMLSSLALVSSCSIVTVQAQDDEDSLTIEEVDDINILRAEHSRKELFLYVRELMCPSGKFSTVESEQYVDLIEYGDNVKFTELCREITPIYETESVYYKVTQTNQYLGDKVAVIMCKISKDHTCFLNFKVILEDDEKTGCLLSLEEGK